MRNFGSWTTASSFARLVSHDGADGERGLECVRRWRTHAFQEECKRALASISS